MVEYLCIPSKPTAPISYTFIRAGSGKAAQTAQRCLIVFVNGLGLPASSWLPAITAFQLETKACPAMLTYDRFGQGLTTARDPLDGTEEKRLGHDLSDVATDLHDIVLTVALLKFGLAKVDVEDGKLLLLLVGASIGVPIARLYAQRHPGTVAGIIMLDSNIANANYSDFLPDPDAPGFDPGSVLDGHCTFQQYKEARAKLTGMFDLAVKNPESLDRTTSPSLLPFSDRPMLAEDEKKGPLLVVVGHDPEAFADISYATMGTPRCISKIVNR